MSADFVIRKLEIQDYHKKYLDLLEQLTIVNSKNIDFTSFQNQFNKLDKSRDLIYIIYDKNNPDQIIGSGTLLLEYKFIRNLGIVGHIEDIIIDQNYRNKKLGSLIINHLMNVAIENNCYKVILDCSVDNIKFYEKCGFIMKEHQMVKYFK